MLKSVIVDDELKSRESLTMLLTNYCNEMTTVCATCKSIDQGLSAISHYNPDIVFLDVELEGESGFDLLERLGAFTFNVIFTTAHSAYALPAIKVAAVDYLLKPVSVTDLRRAISKVKAKIDREHSEHMNLQHKNQQSAGIQPGRLALPSAEGLTFINSDDIIYLKAAGNYTEIHMVTGEKHLVSKQINEYDDRLTEQNFFRIHKSFLINLNHLTNYFKGDGGYVVMSGNIAIDVARRKKEAFLERIGYRS